MVRWNGVKEFIQKNDLDPPIDPSSEGVSGEECSDLGHDLSEGEEAEVKTGKDVTSTAAATTELVKNARLGVEPQQFPEVNLEDFGYIESGDAAVVQQQLAEWHEMYMGMFSTACDMIAHL